MPRTILVPRLAFSFDELCAPAQAAALAWFRSSDAAPRGNVVELITEAHVRAAGFWWTEHGDFLAPADAVLAAG